MTFYLYVIHFDDFFYYVGKRKCPAKYNPWNDPYTGSPKTHKNKWSQTKFKKVVLECFDNDKDVSEAEKNDSEVLTQLANNAILTLDDLSNNSAYLIAEELHPLIFDIALTLDSELPDGVELEE